MNLKDFVQESILQIFEGIEAAQSSLSKKRGRVCPRYTSGQNDIKKSLKMIKAAGGGYIQDIKFDVAVTAEETEGTKATVGVVVGMFGAGAAGHSSDKSEMVSRIQFYVPVVLPEEENENGT